MPAITRLQGQRLTGQIGTGNTPSLRQKFGVRMPPLIDGQGFGSYRAGQIEPVVNFPTLFVFELPHLARVENLLMHVFEYVGLAFKKDTILILIYLCANGLAPLVPNKPPAFLHLVEIADLQRVM